jgi:hypothetical protein
MGSVLGALMAERHGTQSLTLTPSEFAAHYQGAFGEETALKPARARLRA